MKIVVLDGYTLNPGDLSWKGLQRLGELTVYDRTSADEVLARIGDASIVYTNKTVITKEIIDCCPGLEWIGVLATGYNIVDVLAAKAKGIVVCNVPAYSTPAVAQMVFALLLELCNNVGDSDNSVKAGRWSTSKDFCYWDKPIVELCGKTIGIIGLGAIGLATARIAQSFGMNVLAYKRTRIDGLESETLQYAELDELLENSDIISLHCPLTQDNEGMINKDTIAMMKDGVIIINTARGALVVENDLVDALNSGKVACAACDVVSVEPIEKDNPLLSAKNIVLTPHVAWASKESRSRLMSASVKNLEEYLKGNTINAVNI